MARERATADVLHPGRGPARVPEFSAPAPTVDGFPWVDEDVLGEQAIVVLVSMQTGKDDLALAAAEGWAGDRLRRWEADDGRGLTEWITSWESPAQAQEFDYAFGRSLDARLPGSRPSSPGEAAGEGSDRVWVGADRAFHVERRGEVVRVRVTSPAAAPARPAAAPPPAGAP
jgi:hypothetical protein